jgi:hypothetical protein
MGEISNRSLFKILTFRNHKFKMTESTQKSHFLRNREQSSVFKIIRTDCEEQADTVLDNFKTFISKNIFTPGAPKVQKRQTPQSLTPKNV